MIFQQSSYLCTNLKFRFPIEAMNNVADLCSTVFVAISVSGSHNKNLALLLSNRAACLTKVGDCEGCVRDCTRALDLDDSCIKALIRRAAAYEAMEKYVLACYVIHLLTVSLKSCISFRVVYIV